MRPRMHLLPDLRYEPCATACARYIPALVWNLDLLVDYLWGVWIYRMHMTIWTIVILVAIWVRCGHIDTRCSDSALDLPRHVQTKSYDIRSRFELRN